MNEKDKENLSIILKILMAILSALSGAIGAQYLDNH